MFSLHEEGLTRKKEESAFSLFMMVNNAKQLLLKLCACRLYPGDVNGIPSRIDVANDALFVNDEGGPARSPSLFVQDSVQAAHLSLKVTQHCEFYAHLFSKLFLTRPSINTQCNDFRIFRFKIVDIRLISLQFGPSASGKSQDIKGECHILLAGERTQAHSIAVLILQFEVGRLVSDFQAGRLGPGQWGK